MSVFSLPEKPDRLGREASFCPSLFCLNIYDL